MLRRYRMLIVASVIACLWLAGVAAFFIHAHNLRTAHMAWSFELPDSTDLVPDILSDGTIVCSGRGYLYWLTPEGKQQARFDMALAERGSATMVRNAYMLDLAYAAGAGDLCFYSVADPTGIPPILRAIDTAGKEVWHRQIDNTSSLGWIVFDDRHVYAQSDRQSIARLDLEGNLLWLKQPLKNSGIAMLLPAPGDRLYLVDDQATLHCMEGGDRELWSRRLQLRGADAALCGEDGTAYFSDGYQSVVAVGPDGVPRWTYLDSPGPRSALQAFAGLLPWSPPYYPPWNGETGRMAVDSSAVYCTIGETLCAIDHQGQLKWRHDRRGAAGSPEVGPDGTVYCAFEGEGLFALSASGRVVWSNTGVRSFESEPIMGGDGRVLIEADGYLWCFEP